MMAESKSDDLFLCQGREICICRDTKVKGTKRHVKTDAEVGVMQLQAKECQGLLAASRS